MLSRKLLSEIENKIKELERLQPISAESQQKLDKKCRLEFNYNSNHLEGNILTYEETELLLIFDQTEGIHKFCEHKEMQAHDVALKMIKDETKDIERPLTQQFVRSLNEHLLVRSFWKDAVIADGQRTRKEIFPEKYKETPNPDSLANGEVFHYMAPADVDKEMADLVAWYHENGAGENPMTSAALKTSLNNLIKEIKSSTNIN